MFTTPAPSAPTLSTSTSPASPTSPSRSTRLRGLSYLRSYTHSHLHSNQTTRASPNPQTRSPPAASNDSQGSRRDLAQTISLLGGTASSGRPTAGRAAQQSTTPATDSSATDNGMTRNRAETSTTSLSRSQPSPSAADANSSDPLANKAHLPSIRFIPHNDPRAARPSLTFSSIARTLPDENAVIRVGRYSERDNLPEVPNNVASSAPVGFKSKVVSRRHCEFWYSDSRWWIKDVKSSSGTFLNHIRLSQPGVESRPYEIKDGDVVQLGIDFRGGEEMIFRCVKIRIECNRGWQQALNNFNKSTHKRLRDLAKNKTKVAGDAASSHSSECSICLMSIAPCQSLFVAPCSHVWHYKCIRPILQGPTAPSFLCPNCRAVTDLEADIDEVQDFSESDSDVDETIEVSKKDVEPASDAADSSSQSGELAQLTPPTSSSPVSAAQGISNPPPAPATVTISASNEDASATADTTSPDALTSSLSHVNISDAPDSGPQDAGSGSSSHSIIAPIPINTREANSLAPDRSMPECPMTPRNDVGPFVLDGSGSRSGSISRRHISEEMGSLGAASST